MPSDQRPVPGVLGDDVTKQLSAVWHAVNDPQFEAPTNPSAVEQFLTVQSGERPRIVRDVFTVPQGNGGGTVQRGLAIGFDNGHSLLFDFGHGAVRDWTAGDFARQRTEGKSWYWDLAGLRPLEGFASEAEIRLHDPEKKAWIPPTDEDRPRLVGYRTSGTPQSVTLETVLPFTFEVSDHTGVQHELDVVHALKPFQEQQEIGIERTITIAGRSVADMKGPVPYFVLPTKWTAKPGVTIHVLENGEPIDLEGRAAHSLTKQASGDYRVTIRYTFRTPSSPTVLSPAPPAPPKPPAPPVTTLAGYDGTRLPLPDSIMPTAMTWLPDGTLAFTSLKGHVYLARDTNDDGLADTLQLFEEGLAAPSGSSRTTAT
jgi:hypothetical protein